ncbi:hypothetical protein F383_17982 [Gossypium arboreum]|uniref:Uncharacterized protein n=1 Tax=Gossypium arboreum TaxID=29729 RepID=A0A0B0NJN5_GOSAR|nr:hypothetical protein F383_17982 [Gossypium arboreum]
MTIYYLKNKPMPLSIS